MEMKTVLLIAFGLAVGLPYATVILLEQGGRFGVLAMTGLFIAAFALVVLSGRRNEDQPQPDDT